MHEATLSPPPRSAPEVLRVLPQTLHVWYIYLHWGGGLRGQWGGSPMAVPDRSCLGLNSSDHEVHGPGVPGDPMWRLGGPVRATRSPLPVRDE